MKEAFDQLVLLQDRHNRHRRYLAHQWWIFVRALASMRPSHLDFLPNIFERDANDILGLCPCITIDIVLGMRIHNM
jgi:hypothetical protein